MTEIVIHHCTLRLVRHGGWSWGPDPQRLLNAAVRAFPELIAGKLEALWPDDTDLEIAAPVRIAIPVRTEELLAVGAGPDQSDVALEDPTTIALSERLDQALRSTLGIEYIALDETRSKNAPADERPQTEEEYSPQLSGLSAVLRLLLCWRDQQVLEQRLANLSPYALEAWHSHLFEAARQSSTRVAETSPEAIVDLVNTTAHDFQQHSAGDLSSEYVNHFPHSMSDRTALLRHRLITLVEVVAQLKVLPHHPAVREALDRALPLDKGADAELFKDLSSITPAHATPTVTPWPIRKAGASLPRPLRQAEIQVASALPFLILGPLSRIGYLETLTATSEAAELLPELPRFATALAYKVLDPPERGWRRLPAAVNAAAVFAGVEEPVTDPDLAEFARRVSVHLSPLNVVLADTLITGHSPNQPLLLRRANVAKESGLLLTDVEGLFPISWSSELAGLFPTLVRLEQSILLIPQSTADPALLSKLDAKGLHFITDAPPIRHESWRPLRRASTERWWTNDSDAPPAALIAEAQHLVNATDESERLWQALAIDRPCVPLAVSTALECSLILTASLALGTIAWELWRKREPVVPQLALERFRDLDAQVRFDHRSVRVRLPLGRRYQDLYEHGLLGDVRNVPWLGDRVLQFSGG